MTTGKWQVVNLGEITDSMKNGIYRPASAYADDGVACLRMYNIDKGALVWRNIKRMRLAPEELTDYELLPGDLLVNRVNSRELVGKAAVIPEGLERLVFESKNTRLRLKRDLALPKFVNYQLLLGGQRHFSSNAQQVVGMASISQKQVASFPVVLPPIEHQERIVAEIEKQFSRLDEAVANLNRVKANLKRYKAAVLKAAVEGRLVETEAELARREGREYETGEQLLQRIATIREGRYAAASRHGNPPTPQSPPDLPELPEGWHWSTLAAIAAIKGGVTVDRKRVEDSTRSVPYLRVANVQRGYLDLGEVNCIHATEAAINDLRLRPGDVLFNEGGDRDKLGRGWIWEGQLDECIHQNHVFRARLYLHELSPKLVSWWGNSFGQQYFLREGKQTTNLASINLKVLRAFPIPVAPVSEQQRITAEIERLLSSHDALEREVNALLGRIAWQREAILHRLFSAGESRDVASSREPVW
jgi:type I restriction enzyme S subunit